jgi:aspartokinase
VQLVNSDSDVFYTICRGVTETTIIASSSISNKISNLLINERLKSHTTDLASITVKLPAVNSEVYGVYYYILKHLAWEGLNIVEVVSTANEFTIIVKQDHVDKAFKVLMQLKRGK